MKVLFFSIYQFTPHFETELELMMQHVQKGDEICVLTCNRDLEYCEYNLNHSQSVCYKCRAKLENGLSGIPNIKVIGFPKLEIDYSVLPKTFNNLDELKSYTIDGANIGMGVASTLISRKGKEHKLEVGRYVKDIQTHLRVAWHVYNVIRKVHQDEGFDYVYLFNGRFSTVLPVLLYCEQKNIPFSTHERAGTMMHFNVFNNSIPHSVDYAVADIQRVWEKYADQPNREAVGAKFFEDRRNRVIQSWISFTAKQQKQKLPDGFPTNKRVVTVFNSTIEEFAAIRNSGKRFRILNDENTCLKAIFEHFKNDDSIQFYVRMHPNLTGFDNTQTRQLLEFENKYSNVGIIKPHETIDSYELMDHSDKLIVLGSTMGAEGCYWGKPVICVDEALYRDLDCCYWPKTEEELYQLISRDLKPKDRKNVLPYGFWELSRGIPYVHYKPKGLFKGTFDGRPLGLSNKQKINYIAMSLFDYKQYQNLITKPKKLD